ALDNPTLSVLIFDWRSPIADFRQHDSPNQNCAKNSQHGGANHVRQIMCAAVKTRETNQDWDRETWNSDSPIGENQNGKECGQCDNVPGGKRVIFGAQTR